MLTFFRRIRLRLLGQATSDNVRKGLLGQGATPKYLLYAIGEIALVVFGILIALQINNWNEWRKDRISERMVLLDLKETLVRNLNILNESIDRANEQHSSSQLISSLFNEELPYSDTLDWHLYRATLLGEGLGNMTYDGYESFKNTGFEILTSNQLKKQVIFIFEVGYQDLEQWRSKLLSNNHVYTEFRHKSFMQYEKGMKPLDVNSLSNDLYIRGVFYNVYHFRNILLNLLEQSFQETQSVLQLIEEELHNTD